MSHVSEFREFIARGNVIDLAVGVIIGAAFNEIVKVLVDQVDHAADRPDAVRRRLLAAAMGAEVRTIRLTEASELVAIQYGALINASIKFLIVAWVIFLMVKVVNAMRRTEEAKPDEEKTAPPPPQEALLTEIRDLLKTQRAK